MKTFIAFCITFIGITAILNSLGGIEEMNALASFALACIVAMFIYKMDTAK